MWQSHALIGIFLTGWNAILLAKILRNIARSEPLRAFHFGLVLAFSLLGVTSLLLSILFGGVTYLSLNIALLVESLALQYSLRRAQLFRELRDPRYISPEAEQSPTLYILTFVASIGIGLKFFTLDLVPSSMTGDPARHYLQALDLSSIHDATHKPIYRLMLGQLFSTLETKSDKAFVVLNIALFALLNCGTVLLYRAQPTIKSLLVGAAALTYVVTGYSLFALIYGYYTIIPSALFVVSSIYLIRIYVEAPDRRLYWLTVLLLCGAALTHSFVLPAGVLIFASALALSRPRRLRESIADIAPGALVVLAVALVSNWGLIDTSGGQPRIISKVHEQGFVDDTVFANLWPVFGLSMFFCTIYGRTSRFAFARAISIGAALTIVGAVALRDLNLVAPYYANRLQVLVMPILTIACAEGLSIARIVPKWFIGFTAILVFITHSYRYVSEVQAPLSLSDTDFSILRWTSEPIHTQNVELVLHSPLGLTAKDRQTLTDISEGETPCVPREIRRVPVLGSDHTAIWFEIYSNKQASYRDRRDGYISPDIYIADAKDWLAGLGEPFIAIVTHLNYVIPPNLIAKVRRSGTLVCTGDSFEIFRRK